MKPKNLDKNHLTPFYEELSAKYLNESEENRCQALTQFRQWISKDKSIKNCRIDSPFLLKFLRVKKFNITSSYEMFKDYLKAFRLYPRWLQKLTVEEFPLLELFRDGVLIPLQKRDPNGCQTIIYNLKNLNPEKFCQHDIFRLQALVYHICMEDERTQIAGFSVVFDFAGLDFRRYAMFTLVDFNNFCRVVRFAIPVRIFTVYMLSMPKIIQPMYELATGLLTPKLKKRVKVLKNEEELKNLVDLRDFPKEFGGEIEQKDILEDFVEKMKIYEGEMKQLNEITVEIANNGSKEWYLSQNDSKIGNGMVGSFRRLAVD